MVKAVETTLAQLLEGTKQFQVPLYQRTYSWDKTQHRRLWDDLVQLAEDRRSRGPAVTHFIGSVVLAPSPAIAAAGLQEFLVVDGQQRLTTLTLLLAAIRDHRAETESSHHIERVNDLFLINKWITGQPTKVLPTQADCASYLACIHRTPQAGGGDPVGAAYRFFRARLTEFDDPTDDLDVQRLEEAVIAGLSLVCVTAQTGDNVHRIFESLNNTGLRLTQADLIRNYLFMRLPNRGEQVYRGLWLPLQRQLNPDQLELLFWLDLVQDDETAKQTDTYALQQARLDRISSEEEMEAEIERFARLGTQLAVILDPSRETNVAVRRQLERLNQWGTTTVYPVLLHLLDRRAAGDATDDDLATAMKHLESFFVRRLVIGQATKNLNRILLGAVREIRTSANVAEGLMQYLSSGRKFFASDAEIRSAVQSVPFYWSGKAGQKTLVMRWIEESYGSKESVKFEGLTIEHVLPQTLTEEWRDVLVGDLEPGEDVEGVFQSLLHLVGNLTLTGYNAELSNKPFGAKRPALASSALRMNQEIAQSPRWGRAEILARSNALAERIVSIWPGPVGAGGPDPVSARWSSLAQVLAVMPAGTWTTYGDVAAVVGTHAVPLGQRLAHHPTLNAHRVMTVDGTIAANFRWLDPSETRAARYVLEQEGVAFDDQGRADPGQRLTASDLAVLAEIDGDVGVAYLDEGLDGQAVRFFEQLADDHPQPVVDGVKVMLSAWTDLGGRLGYGDGAETSCFVLPAMSPEGRHNPWPFTIYPSGKVVVVFQHMAQRPPFDDAALRREFLARLNTIEGIDLPESRIGLRPGFDVAVLADPARRDAVIEQLAWFAAQLSPAAKAVT